MMILGLLGKTNKVTGPTMKKNVVLEQMLVKLKMTMTFVSLCRQTRLCRHTITNLLEKKNKQDKQGMMSRLKVKCFKSLTSVTKPVSLKGISPQVRCLTSSSLADCEGQAMYLGDLPAPTIPAQRTSTLLTALSRPSP